MPYHARLAYTIFVAFTLGALAITVWLLEDMVRLDLSKLDEYYAGQVATPGVGALLEEPPVEGEGAALPAMELPEEAALVGAAQPMSLRKLLEVTHFHLFSMPVYLLIISHLYMLTMVGSRQKTFWMLLGAGATAAHLLAPWVARAGGPSATALYALSGTLLAAAYLVMCAVPLWEMWRPIGSAESNAG